MSLDLIDGEGYLTGDRFARVGILDGELSALSAGDAKGMHQARRTACCWTAAGVSRVGDLAPAVTVDCTLSDEAEARVDFVALSGEFTIPAGETSAEVELEPIDDEVLEGTESLVFTLRARQGARFVVHEGVSDEVEPTSAARC